MYVKLADFGFATTGTFMLNGNMGTPAYKAPELYLEQLHGCEVDVWSFGVIAFQLLSGNQLPFAAT